MLTFGTAGIRAILGHQAKQLNHSHIIYVADGLARYLLKTFPNARQKGVVIGRDNRKMSYQFAKMVCYILAKKYKIKVYISQNLFATPLVSYAIGKLQAIAGVNITASHNPKEYNGIKIYNQAGYQILDHEVEKLSKFFRKVSKFSKRKIKWQKIHFDQKRIIKIDYLQQEYVKELANFVEVDSSWEPTFTYSPLHGCGAKMASLLAKEANVKLAYVSEQMPASTKFHFASKPNPEELEVYQLIEKKMLENNIDYGFVTDPDADRLGVIEKLPNNTFYHFSGNEQASLLVYFLLKNKHFSTNPLIIYSFVSSSLPALIASKNNIKSMIVPTGFKWIGEQIVGHQGSVFAFEESYGSLIFPQLSLDKDAFQIMYYFWKILKNQDISLKKTLDLIYQKYGFVQTQVNSFNFKGEQKLINQYFDEFLETDFGLPIEEIVDYRKNNEKMIQIFFKNKSWVALRPSGTEAKVKLYIFSIASSSQIAIDNSNLIAKKVEGIFTKNE
ncbi:Phosphoglucomutase [Mesomycoplasma conjunctivae]|uniref:Phosphomannomutase n=1 Tax=Mesomycoplasma conjunctivae (strain ATCC 25834 / NCTC 10147 / HRC/581) TaxID=572263 RepID=C5J6I7_MESCH|nr:phospho-sugar mutase [Mesomycoplasma conjunctivae]CAT05079.1 Phosphomannomutase [Mesomycoplasma conjunctivae]VEU66264.1 Phosphoglucomutase [Mesomycoplasma conjunctivae]